MASTRKTVLDTSPAIPGLSLRNRGKVRDTYDLPDHPELMFSFVTDDVSIYDFPLNGTIAQKGEILNAVNIYWRLYFRQEFLGEFPDDLVAFGPAIDEYLPIGLRGNVDRHKRGTIIRKLKMIPVEGVVRGFLTGSAYDDEYALQTGDERTVYGYKLPAGLMNGSPLSPALFTPTTKAKTGHDKPMSPDEVRKQYPKFSEGCLYLYQAAREHAEERGFIIADTKLEGDAHGTFGDEWFTFDSSRFWLTSDYQAAMKKGTLPPSFDKQFVRDWGSMAGIKKRPDGTKRDPEDAHDRAFVHALSLPGHVRRMTTALYRYGFWRLAEQKLETFQREVMKVNVRDPRPRIEILIGSESDYPQIKAGLDILQEAGADFAVTTMNCYSRPDAVHVFCADADYNIVIAGAGKAAALPGTVKAWLCHYGHPEIPVVGVALQGEELADNLAAISSISRLPGQPVVMDDGNPYFGPEGFAKACAAVLSDELLPKTML